MRASCRIAAAVVTAVAADYSLRMAGATETNHYRVIERGGPGGRLVLRAVDGDRTNYLVVAGFRGGDWPEAISNLQVVARESAAAGSWRLSSDQGRFDFAAQAVDRVETRPALFEQLHRPFALTATDRIAVRLLLALLRLPGGARLLRSWHSRRGG